MHRGVRSGENEFVVLARPVSAGVKKNNNKHKRAVITLRDRSANPRELFIATNIHSNRFIRGSGINTLNFLSPRCSGGVSNQRCIPDRNVQPEVPAERSARQFVQRSRISISCRLIGFTAGAFAFLLRKQGEKASANLPLHHAL